MFFVFIHEYHAPVARGVVICYTITLSRGVVVCYALLVAGRETINTLLMG